jgi:AcrR family transcriptional regulator
MSARTPTAVTRARATHLGPSRRRPLILDVAFGLFLERGYKGTSMDAIARAAGVTKPVVYACFASKAELFGALLDREEQRMFAQVGAAFATGYEPRGLEAMLVAGLTAMLQAASDTPETYRVALLGGGDIDAFDALIDARLRRGREHLVSQLTELVRRWLEGRVPEPGVEGMAQFAAQTLAGIGDAGLRMMLTSPERWTPEALGQVLGRFATAGFAGLELG